MRKRTYTALDAGTDCVSGIDIGSADYVPVFQNNSAQIGAAAASIAVATQGSRTGTAQDHSNHLHPHSHRAPPTSHRGAVGAIPVDSPPPPTKTVSPAHPNTNATPLTTIHNRVGTCDIASSVTPIDLECVSRASPTAFMTANGSPQSVQAFFSLLESSSSQAVNHWLNERSLL